MASKREYTDYIDAISEATPQNRRRTAQRMLDPAPADKHISRLSHWPPEHLAQWRAENLTPWRQKPWKSGDWE